MMLAMWIPVWGLLYAVQRGDAPIRFIKASILFGTLLTLITELLSVMTRLNAPFIQLSWGIVLVCLLVYAVRWRAWSWERIEWVRSPAEAVLLGGIVVILLLSGMGASYAPITNWDSMTYHMPRIMHWFQHESLVFYPTTLWRQLFQGPFAEMAIAHTMGLSGGDAWANFVQWFALVVCIIGAGVLARQMGGNRLTQWVASALVASIPMAVLQASSTQTDLVVSMWLVAFAVMTLHYTETRSRFDLACAGFALGLCILSKGTAYVLAFPMGVWFLVWVWRVNRWRSWQPWLIAGACVVLVNVGHWTRNQLLFHTPIGAADGYANETFSPIALASNLIRNSALHMPTPFERVNEWVFRAVRYSHNYLLPGFTLEDPRTTYLTFGYEQNRLTANEDIAPSPAHFYLTLLALVIFAVPTLRPNRAPHRYVLEYGIMAIGMFVMFSWLFKWQIWSTRLMLPIFVMGMPCVAMVLAQLKWRAVSVGMSVTLLVLAVPYLLYNCYRPLIPHQINGFSCGKPPVWQDRQAAMYYSRNGIRVPYETVAQALHAQTDCQTVGIVVNGDSWEYPLWLLLDDPTLATPFYLHHVLVPNGSNRAPYPQTLTYCALVASPAKSPEYVVDGVTFKQVLFMGDNYDNAALYLP